MDQGGINNDETEDANHANVVVADENEESWRQSQQRSFNGCCQKIQDNDMSMEELNLKWLPIDNNNRARQFSRALGQNKRIKKLTIWVARGSTLLGAQLIADGISCSGVQSLTLYYDDQNTYDNILPLIYLQAMQTIRELDLHRGKEMRLDLNGLNLLRIAERLATCQQLKSISIRFYPNAENFNTLAAAVRASGLEHMLIWYHHPVTNEEPSFREAMSTFWTAAVEKLKHITLPLTGHTTTEVLGNALVGNTSLETLEFPASPFTHHRARQLAIGIANSQIQCIRNFGIHATGSVEDDLIVFNEGIAAAPNLKKLCIYKFTNFASHEAMGNVLRRLETLEIRSWRSSWNFEAFLSGVNQTPLLKELTLSKCNLRDADLEALVGKIRHLQITKLDISQNEIGNQGAGRLSQLLTASALPIHELYVKYNRIGPEGACAMVEATTVGTLGTHLRTLDLSQNLDVGFRGLTLIAQTLPHLVLDKLFLNQVTRWHAAPQEDLQLQQQSGKAWTDNIQHNQHIRVLGLKYVNFPSTVMNDIYFWVNINKYCRPFLQGELLFHGEWSHVMAKCQHFPWYAASLTFFLLKEDPANFVT